MLQRFGMLIGFVLVACQPVTSTVTAPSPATSSPAEAHPPLPTLTDTLPLFSAFLLQLLNWKAQSYRKGFH